MSAEPPATTGPVFTPRQKEQSMNHIFRLTTLGGVVALLAACASNVKLDETPPVESRTGTPPATSTATRPQQQGSGVGSNQVAPVAIGGGNNAAATLDRVVYFDYDSFVVKEDFRPLIESHAKLLAANKGKRMVVEGHTDERGGREYNLALGQKRAEAVAKSLALLGAGDSQLEAVSFGKERPAATGSDEVSWAKNRRAELKDR
jgi:peptidoglycan-associated lipoprotein